MSDNTAVVKNLNKINTGFVKNLNKINNIGINRSPPNKLTSLMPILFQPAQASIQCASTCVGRTTSEYNPVCGTDGENYHNPARLDCARDCGVGE